MPNKHLVRNATCPAQGLYFFCEATGQSVGVRRVSFFLSHEQKSAHVCACHPWQEGHAATSECAGAMLFFSTPKENLLDFSISSVGRLFHPHSPLLFHSNQASAKSAYGQKECQENSIGCFEPFQKRELRAAHMSADSSSGLGTPAC